MTAIPSFPRFLRFESCGAILQCWRRAALTAADRCSALLMPAAASSSGESNRGEGKMFRRSRALLIPMSLISVGAWAQPPAPVSPAPPAPRAHSTTIRSFGRRGYLGVGVREMTDERARALNLKDSSGVEVKRVEENSPA